MKIEILPAGAVVGPRDIIDAVDAGLVEAGFAWTHYWGGKRMGHQSLARASPNIFNHGSSLAAVKNFMTLWDEMGVNVKGFMLQPVGPEALGWFPSQSHLWHDIVNYASAPPGMVGAAYNEIGVAAVAMGGGDILPALEKGAIDAAERCCPQPDSVFGFQKVRITTYKVCQVTVNADMYLNRDVYNSLSFRAEGT